MSGSKQFPWHIVVFLAPAFVIYTIFMIYPLVDSLRLGLYAPSLENPRVEEFVGLQNYETLVTEPRWSERLFGAIKNNLLFFGVHMLVQNPIGLLLATLLSSSFIKGRALYRTLIFTPTILSVVLIGFIWRLILSPLWGIGDDILRGIGLGDFIQPWLGTEGTALIEAARVDGATAFDIFWQIKFPLILPTVGTVSILTFVGNFNAFDLIYTVQGGLATPNFSTDILGTFFYRTFFGFQLQAKNPTMGAAIAGVMFLIILIGVLIYLFGYQQRITQVEM
jgi:raffinose/stachyose/melibiose transport system permease protein